MFSSQQDQIKYILETYPEVTDARVDDDHWDLNCPQCKTTRGFQVIERNAGQQYSVPYSQYVVDNYAPLAIYFRCPVCRAYKQWIVYKIIQNEKDETGNLVSATHYYRVASLPSEGIEDIIELPNEPPALRTAYRQAIRCMDANAHIAAAAMFRRALQIITRDILGVTPGNLGTELRQVIGKKINDVTIVSDFGSVGYIIKEAGNQGAHPDRDPDLLEFSAKDAEDLQRIFMELITDLFVAPAAAKKAKEEFLSRRKISMS